VPLATIGWPVLDRIHLFGDFAISPHGIGIAIGVLFGAWIWSVEGPKRGVSVDHINTMLFWVLVGAIVGARLFWVIGHFSRFDGIADMLSRSGTEASACWAASPAPSCSTSR
jgi:prolipoprotein diacylglyceryltransferase